MIKILLMEDDLNLCQSIQQALKKEGYSVDCCRSRAYRGAAEVLELQGCEYESIFILQ